MAHIIEMSLELVDRPDLPWSFVDAITSVSVENKAVCKVEFSATRWAPSQQETKASGRQYPVCRLAMSLSTMAEVHARLTRILKQLESEGVVHRSEPSPKSLTLN